MSAFHRHIQVAEDGKTDSDADWRRGEARSGLKPGFTITVDSAVTSWHNHQAAMMGTSCRIAWDELIHRRQHQWWERGSSSCTLCLRNDVDSKQANHA